MLRSMTGFGAGRAREADEEVAVELRAVNHKFCEVKTRLPRELLALEAALTKRIKQKLARGAIDVSVKRTVGPAGEQLPRVNAALARAYKEAFQAAARDLGLDDTLRLRDVLDRPGVIELAERGVAVEAAQAAAERALDQALDALIAMRETEGKALLQDLSSRLDTVEALSTEVAALSPRAVEEYRDKLTARIAELVQAGSVDPQRLAQEVALFADRTDVTEESTRLASHLVQFRALLAAPEPSGRKMDFLVQEMHREVNTTGSKSQHPEISSRIVSLKAELERIREQVQNVE
jgi:uncharacterized protein (TIGR00255 family)